MLLGIILILLVTSCYSTSVLLLMNGMRQPAMEPSLLLSSTVIVCLQPYYFSRCLSQQSVYRHCLEPPSRSHLSSRDLQRIQYSSSQMPVCVLTVYSLHRSAFSARLLAQIFCPRRWLPRCIVRCQHRTWKYSKLDILVPGYCTL